MQTRSTDWLNWSDRSDRSICGQTVLDYVRLLRRSLLEHLSGTGLHFMPIYKIIKTGCNYWVLIIIIETLSEIQSNGKLRLVQMMSLNEVGSALILIVIVFCLLMTSN